MAAGMRCAAVALAGAMLLAVLAGCAGEGVYENLYEGVRMQDPPAEPERMPAYGEYRRYRWQVIESSEGN